MRACRVARRRSRATAADPHKSASADCATGACATPVIARRLPPDRRRHRHARRIDRRPLSGEPLGDKLAKSDGVMCPAAGVDPEIARRRRSGQYAVIPPPAAPRVTPPSGRNKPPSQ